MAVQTWYLDQIAVGGGQSRLFWDLSTEAGATAETTSTTGWTVGKIAANNYSLLQNGTERATGTFTTTIAPNNTAPVSDETFSPAVFSPPPLIIDSESIATLYEYNGYFPAGTWTFAFPVIAVSAGGAQDGRITMRVFKGQRDPADDTAWINVTELTAALLSGTIVTNLTTAASQTSTVTWSAPAFFLNNEFLIAKMAWQITGAGGANTQDVLIRYGVTATATSTTFRDRTYNIN
jgi:hypothetical protein